MRWLGSKSGAASLPLICGFHRILPALEAHALQKVGAVANGVDIGPGADVIGADFGLLDQLAGIWHLAQVERLIKPVIRVEPSDMGRGEGDIALGIALGELLLVQPIDGAAGDVFDRNAGLGGELLADNVGDHVAPASAPNAHDELVLGVCLDRRE